MYREMADFVAGRTDSVMLYDDKGNPAYIIERHDLGYSENKLYQEYVLDDKDKSFRELFNKFHRDYHGGYKDPDRKRKSVGGKKPYVMLMTKEIQALRESFVEDKVKNYNEIIGCLINFSEYMEWGTGKLIDKRQKLKKKQIPLKYKDLLEISSYSKGKFESMMKIMKDYKLLWHSDENEENKGYFISQEYFKKGKRGS